MFWSYLLMAVGVLGLYLIGKKVKFGWVINIAAQFLWVIYAVATEQYGFIISAIVYSWVYAKGLRNFDEPRKTNA